MKKSIGDMPAFACEADGGCGPWPGMTYRQWLLGQALAGNLAYPGVGTGFSAEDAVRLSFSAVELAIEELDSQAKEDSCSKETHDQSEPVTERKPLLGHHSGLPVCFAVSEDGTRWTAMSSQEDQIRNWLCEGKRVVRVLEPVGNECPTERVALGCEWGIVRVYGESFGWCGSSHLFYHHAAVLTQSLRFPSMQSAQAYIDANGVPDCQPWPIPPKGADS